MNTGRFATPGKTRSCPHCKATILDSAAVCPACQHHLRFDSTAQQVQPALTPLHVEGTLRHPSNGGTWEYSVVLTIRDRRGQEIARQVVGVGALQPGDERGFTLAVEVFKPAEAREQPRPQAEATPARVPGRPPVPPRVPVPPLSAPAVARPSPGAAPAAPRAGAPLAPGSSAPQRSPGGSAGTPSRPATTGSWPMTPSPNAPKPQPKRS